MPVSKANQRAVNKYVKNNYDRINVTMPKGEKSIVKAHAEAAGESVNAYILRAVHNAMEPGNATKGDSVGAEGRPLLLVECVDMETVKAHAEKMGETVDAFIRRAVEAQIGRDEMALKLNGMK